MISTVLEILRYVGVGVGVYLALYSGQNPVDQFSTVCLWSVLSLAGLTGVEGFFFGRQAADKSGYSDPGPYQRQSALNNLALAVTTILVYGLGWGLLAKMTVMTVLLVFLILSASNHGYTAWKGGNRSLRNMLRPMATTALVIVIVPFMIRALTYTAQ